MRRKRDCSLRCALIVIPSIILPNGVQKLRKFWTGASNYPNPSFTSLHNNNTPIFMARWEANNREFHPVNVELEQLVAKLQFPVEATIRITGPQIHGCCKLCLNAEAWRIRTDRNTNCPGARSRQMPQPVLQSTSRQSPCIEPPRSLLRGQRKR